MPYSLLLRWRRAWRYFLSPYFYSDWDQEGLPPKPMPMRSACWRRRTVNSRETRRAPFFWCRTAQRRGKASKGIQPLGTLFLNAAPLRRLVADSAPRFWWRGAPISRRFAAPVPHARAAGGSGFSGSAPAPAARRRAKCTGTPACWPHRAPCASGRHRKRPSARPGCRR